MHACYSPTLYCIPANNHSKLPQVIDISLRKGSKDNMTTLIVQLPALKYGTGGGVTARREKLDAELKSLNEDGNHMSNASPEAEQE